jgi:hypothetical protein
VAKDKQDKHTCGVEPTPVKHLDLHIGPTTPHQTIVAAPFVAGTPRFEERPAATPAVATAVPPVRKGRPSIKEQRVLEILADLDREGRLSNLRRMQPADVKKLVVPRYKELRRRDGEKLDLEVSMRTIENARAKYLEEHPAK